MSERQMDLFASTVPADPTVPDDGPPPSGAPGDEERQRPLFGEPRSIRPVRWPGSGGTVEVRVGTSGFDLEGWTGPFYPPGIRPSERLPYYASRFSTVEVNCTFYRLPRPGLFRSMLRRTPPGFEFAVKAFRGITHQPGGPEVHAAFRRGLEPLLEAGRLGAVLCQFPGSFREGGVTRTLLRDLRRHLPDLPLVVELRHSSWARRETFDLLADHGLSYGMTDLPPRRDLMPPVARATGDLAYLRLHSRNASLWSTPARYDYSYSDGELLGWRDRLRTLAGKTRRILVYFNNCRGAEAARNAERFRELLEERTREATAAA